MNLFDLFKISENNLEHPKLHIPHDLGKITIWIAKKAITPSFPNYLYINLDSVYLGKVTKENQLVFAREISEELQEIIKEIYNNPLKFCQIVGRQFSFCCFCGTKIISQDSLAVGYGPICAEKWGLPWEGMAIEKKLAEISEEDLL